jgi:hypothetical protein
MPISAQHLRRDHSLPTVFTRADALAAGLSRNQIERRIRAEWRPLRRGVFCANSQWERATPVGRHLLSAAALVTARPADTHLTLSHLSAAAVWGLPLPPGDAWPVEATTRPGTLTPDTVDGARLHVATLRPVDRAFVRGAWVTTPARTVADCLRHGGPSVGVPMADAALHLGFADDAELDDVLSFQSHWPFAGRALACRPWIAPRESWLESRSFVAFAESGLSLPESQVDVFDAKGRFVARVDFAWIPDGVVGESDGLGKYDLSSYGRALGERALVDVDVARRRLLAEKSRHRQLEDLNLRVVRWGTADVEGTPARLVDRIQQVRRRWSGDYFTGRFALAAPHPRVTPRVHPEMPHIRRRNPQSRGNAALEG